jgi:hypothetical protein
LERASYGAASATIRTFIDLTEERELAGYAPILQALSAERGLATRHIRQSIRDYDRPRDRAQMIGILATIRKEIAAGRPVYVHCWGGMVAPVPSSDAG